MAGSVSIERKTADSPALAIGGRFKGYNPEEEKASSKAEVRESEAVKQMKAAWKAWKYDPDDFIRDNYRATLMIVKNLQYSAKDVEEFSLVLEEFQYEEGFSNKAGLFLSALINNGNESDYLIHTQHLKMPPGNLGYKNEKNIIVNGDVGYFVGISMKGGSITVKGNAGGAVGSHMKNGSITVEGNVKGHLGSDMEGGSITVEGDAEDAVGMDMQGGTITVNGNADTNVGYGMKGGEISLEGDYRDLSGNTEGGKIYHKGNLIFPYYTIPLA
jgi:formylmethanofuran dehydrogenase subunit C